MSILDFNSYLKPSVTVDGVVLTTDIQEPDNNRRSSMRKLQVLLVKRPIEPYKDMWALPGGFMSVDKTLETTLKEKLSIKTNISNVYTEQLHVYDAVERDPRGRVLTVVYLVACSKDKFNTVVPQEGSELAWFWVDLASGNLKLTRADNQSKAIGADSFKLAFDHEEIIIDAIGRMANLSATSNCALNLLPSEFTIRECQDVYEQLAGKTIYSFRRMIEDKIEPTDTLTYGAAHRPAKLYRIKRDSSNES